MLTVPIQYTGLRQHDLIYIINTGFTESPFSIEFYFSNGLLKPVLNDIGNDRLDSKNPFDEDKFFWCCDNVVFIRSGEEPGKIDYNAHIKIVIDKTFQMKSFFKQAEIIQMVNILKLTDKYSFYYDVNYNRIFFA